MNENVFETEIVLPFKQIQSTICFNAIEVFDNFSKVYVSTEDLAARRMYIHVDPDGLLFRFD